jgi:formamidopyrimidine-DNA glycosylase
MAHPAFFMPELPEVETTRRGIAPHVTGRRVVWMDVYDRRLRWPVPDGLEARMAGTTIDRVDRRGKNLLLRARRIAARAPRHDRLAARMANAAFDAEYL